MCFCSSKKKKVNSADQIYLSYWGIPAKGQVPRLLLEYLDLPYHEKRYTPDTATEWFGRDKHGSGFDFPNLPMVVDGSQKISENIVITSYLPTRANQSQLNGKGIDKFQVDQIKNLVNDIYNSSYLGSVEEDPEKKTKIWNENLLPKYQYLTKFYKKNVKGSNKFFMNYLTVADFYVYTGIMWTRQAYEIEYINSGLKNEFSAFLHAFENIPRISVYMKSSKYIPYKISENNNVVKPKKNKMKLYYWGIPAKGQTSRLLLEYCGADYEEVRYTPDTASDWFGGDKQKLGFDFPNLPGLIDGKTNISENIAVASYIPYATGNQELNGKGTDRFMVEQIKNVVNDVFGFAYQGSQEKDESAKQAIWNEKLKVKLAQLEKFYVKNQWAVGYLTVADFFIYCGIQWTRQSFDREWQDEFSSSMQSFLNNFEQIPKIKKYMSSDRYIPYNV